MKFVFVRHGQTDYNKQKLLQGQRIDAPLNEAGRAQAKRLAKELAGDFDVICSSPLKRAFQTAEIIADELGVPIKTYDELKERDFGSLSGKPYDEIAELYGEEIKKGADIHNHDYTPYGGESADEVKERVQKFLQKAKNRWYPRRVLAVSHTGVLLAMHFVYVDMEMPEVSNASIHKFDI